MESMSSGYKPYNLAKRMLASCKWSINHCNILNQKIISISFFLQLHKYELLYMQISYLN